VKRHLFLTAALVLFLPVTVAAQELTEAQKAALAAAQAATAAKPVEPEQKKPCYWKNSMSFDVGLSGTYLNNWSAGGYNNLVLALGADLNANYAKDLLSWTNRLQLNYGFLWSQDKKDLLQKSSDRIYFDTKFSYKTGPTSKWKYTANYDFRSQFSNTRSNYHIDEQSGKWVGDLQSGFLSPAYTNLALGMEWVPAKWFNMSIAPVTGGFTIVTEESLRKKYGLAQDKSAVFQFGAQIKANVNLKINDNITYDTQVVVFTDYLNCPFRHNRVNWDNNLVIRLSKLLGLGLQTWMIYDPNVVIDDVKSKTQFKTFLSLKFTYVFTPVQK